MARVVLRRRARRYRLQPAGRGIEPALLIAVFAGCGPYLVMAPLATLLAVTAVVALYHRVVSPAMWILVAGTACVGAARAEARLAEYERTRAQVSALLRPPARCAIRAHVVKSPTRREGTLRFSAQVLRADCEGSVTTRPFLVRLYGGPEDLRRGDVVEVNAQLGVIRLFRNHDLVDPIPFAARTGEVASGTVLSLQRVTRTPGVSNLIDMLRSHVRERIEQTFAPGAVGLAKALVLGENDLTQQEDHSFKVSGLAHLLAVSGTHLVFAVVSIVLGLRAVLVRLEVLAAGRDVARIAYLCGAFLALIYADFAGGSGSAWRAAWMLTIGFALRSLGREASAAQCVAGSVLVGLAVDPLVSLDLSFLLSLAATAGLMTLGKRWARRSTRISHPGLRLLWLSACATLASTLPCSVVLASLATEISWLGLIANCLVAPFGEMIALPLCLVHAVTHWAPPLERGLGLTASGALLVVRQVALLVAQTEGLGLPVPYFDRYQYAALVVVAAAGLRWREDPRRGAKLWALGWAAAGGVGLLAAEWRLYSHGHPHGKLRATFLDVGQGDAALVDLPDGSLMLIDGGGFVGVPIDPGTSVILPVLRARRRQRIDVMVVSHPHPDHFGGLLSVLARIPVGQLWDTGQGKLLPTTSAYSSLLATARSRGVELKGPEELCGDRLWRGVELSVFGPCPTYLPHLSPNDNSFVLRLAHGEGSVLFAGDAEVHQEQQLVTEHGSRLRSTVLKVSHHGSRTSSSASFLNAVQPQIAVVSCGIRNRFGHPHAEALLRLGSAGSRLWRTDESGSGLWIVAE